MFLFSLICFPLISYYLFNNYKNNIIELKGIIKIIWIIWLFLLFTIWYFDIFNNKKSYLVLVILWNSWVFIYFYINYINLSLNNLNKIKITNFSYTNWLVNILYLFFVFILYANIIDNYNMKKALGILNYNSTWFLNYIFYFLLLFLFTWTIFKFIDMGINLYLRTIINNSNDRETLKIELKKEILNELKDSI